MGRLKIGQVEDHNISLGPISILFMVLAIFVGLYLSVQTDVKTMVQGQFIVITIASGFVIHLVINSGDLGIVGLNDYGGVRKNMFYTAMAVMSILILNVIATGIEGNLLPAGVFSERMYYAMAGVGEEFAFRLGLFQYLNAIGVPLPMSILGSAFIFASFHLIVYGGSLTALGIMFGGGVVFAVVTHLSKSLMPATLSHFLINFMAGI